MDSANEQAAQAAQADGVPVARPGRRGAVGRVVAGAVSLLKGMRVTIGYLVRPSTVVTQQYPENRATLRLAERTRNQLSLIHDEQGRHRCTACRSCEIACPNASIRVISRKGPVTGRNEIDHFVWRHDTCTFCNQCVVVCPFNALTMSGSFESAVFDRRLLVYSLNRYAGPPGPVLDKVEKEEDRRAMMEPRRPYAGPVPMNGQALAGIPEPLPAAGAAAPAPPAGKEGAA